MGSDDEWFEDFEEDSDQAESIALTSSDGGASSDDDTPLHGEQTPNKSNSRLTMYTLISKANLEAMQNEALAQVQAILGCTTTTARALLTFFNWDAENVLSTIAERGDEEVYKRAGVLPRAADAAAAMVQDATCGVCFSEMRDGEAVAMSCGHTFCASCWQQHVSIGIKEGMSRRLLCMAPGCGVLCDEGQVKNLLHDAPDLLHKYEQALIDGYVDDNRRVRWCPSVPHCGNAVRVNGDAHCDISCPCGRQFCFACGENPHSPSTCEMIRQWVRRIQDGTETASWLRANTKPCPKCSKPVEKNGGCNLVLCHCGQAFCWLCGQSTGRAHDWHNIHGHSCGAYKEEAESRVNEGQRNLKRYLHYLTRYEAHLASLELEERARAELEKKIDSMIEADTSVASYSLSNYSWVMDALNQLFLARRVMAYSYVFAFYVFGDEFKGEFSPETAIKNKELFEDKQGQLEVEVERLANFIEVTQGGRLAESRLLVINLASSINSRIEKMYDVIENEIAPQVAGRSMDIAPYRGQRAKGNNSSAAAVLAAVAAQAERGRAQEEQSGAAPLAPPPAAPWGESSARPASAGMKRQRQN